MDSPGTGVVRSASVPARGGREEGEAGVVAALTAYAYLWRCRRVGARARTLGRPLLVNAGNLELGADVLIDSRAGAVALVCHPRGRLVVGDGARIGPSARIEAAHLVEVGDRARIGARSVIADADGEGEAAEIWIGDDVVLGEDVRVLPGTVIGAGAVIAPGTVVRGRIPPGAAVGGEPGSSGG